MKPKLRQLVWSQGANHCVLLPPTRSVSPLGMGSCPARTKASQEATDFYGGRPETPLRGCGGWWALPSGRGSVLSERWHPRTARSPEGGREEGAMLGTTLRAVPHQRVSSYLGSFSQCQCAFQHPAPDTRAFNPQKNEDTMAPAPHRGPEPSYYVPVGDPWQ